MDDFNLSKKFPHASFITPVFLFSRILLVKKKLYCFDTFKLCYNAWTKCVKGEQCNIHVPILIFKILYKKTFLLWQNITVSSVSPKTFASKIIDLLKGCLLLMFLGFKWWRITISTSFFSKWKAWIWISSKGNFFLLEIHFNILFVNLHIL